MSVAIKTHRSLLASAARTATTASAKQADPVQQFARVYLNVTAASGTGGLTVFFRGYDFVSGVAGKLNAGGTAIIATGMNIFELSPGSQAASGDVKETVSRMLPTSWDVQVVHADSSSYTYSLSCEVFPG